MEFVSSINYLVNYGAIDKHYRWPFAWFLRKTKHAQALSECTSEKNEQAAVIPPKAIAMLLDPDCSNYVDFFLVRNRRGRQDV